MSLLGHAILALGLSRLGPAAANADSGIANHLALAPPPPALALEPEDPKPQPPRDLRLGIANGAMDTLTWLGFDEETEHSARQGPTEQSALTLNPAPGARRGSNPPPAPAPLTPPDRQAAAPEAELSEGDETRLIAETRQAQPAEPRQPLDHALARALAEQISQAAESAVAATERVSEAFQQLLESRRAGAPAPEAKTSQIPSPTTQPPARTNPETPETAAAQPQSNPGGAPGLQSEREAIAVAVRNAPSVRPGKVLAAEGLEILTRAPRFAITTQLLKKPRNPTVSVSFGRDGLVRRAVFVSDGRATYSTGADEIDQPLLNAVYSWSARGQALKDLPADDPQAGITIMFTILLGG